MIVISITVFWLAIGIGIGFFGAVVVATIIDWYRTRRDRRDQVWNELKRTDYKPRRPAAK